MQVKHSTWFAAGPEIERALHLLSDGAFRLYLFICFNASRRTGVYSSTYADISESLRKSRRAIATHFDELRKEGVCCIQPAGNQHQTTRIRILDDFWPYIRMEVDAALSDIETELKQVRKMLQNRGCVQCAFNAADRLVVEELLANGVSLKQIERGVALGCSRKYVSILNGSDTGPIQSFAYFKNLIEEAGDENTPAGYWDYLLPQLQRLEAQWRTKMAGDANSASPAGFKNEETR